LWWLVVGQASIVPEFRWNYAVGFAFMVLAAFFIFKKW